jgi:ABC-2 type transport system ATP-binding protein
VLVDEVLAVGDRRFREKCYRRMEELVGGGRTLFLVSHSEADLKRFCTRGIYLANGSVAVDDEVGPALAAYRADQSKKP